MPILDMLETAFGGTALQQVAARIGLPPDQLESVVSSLAPSIFSKLQTQSTQWRGSGTSDSTPPPGTDEAEHHGNSILGSIFGSKEVSRSVAQQTADQTRVGVDRVKKALPQVASMIATAMRNGQLPQGAAGWGSILDEVGR